MCFDIYKLEKKNNYNKKNFNRCLIFFHINSNCINAKLKTKHISNVSNIIRVIIVFVGFMMSKMT